MGKYHRTGFKAYLGKLLPAGRMTKVTGREGVYIDAPCTEHDPRKLRRQLRSAFKHIKIEG